jgi:hypothetical protein
MKIKYLNRILPLVLLAISSCNKEEISEFTDTPIIESYLQPGDYLNVKIRKQTAFSSVDSSSDVNVDNLAVKVTINDVERTLQSLGNGIYIDSSIRVSGNDRYTLSFPYNSKNVQAYTYIPSKPATITQSVTELSIEQETIGMGPPTGNMASPVTISWSNPDNSYYLLVVENMEGTLSAIRSFGNETPPSNLFRKQPTNLSSAEIRPMEFQYYGRHRIIIYHVLPDYAALYNQSSTSSQNLSNPSTSITNGYGIFTGLNSDTLMINVKEG